MSRRDGAMAHQREAPHPEYRWKLRWHVGSTGGGRRPSNPECWHRRLPRPKQSIRALHSQPARHAWRLRHISALETSPREDLARRAPARETEDALTTRGNTQWQIDYHLARHPRRQTDFDLLCVLPTRCPSAEGRSLRSGHLAVRATTTVQLACPDWLAPARRCRRPTRGPPRSAAYSLRSASNGSMFVTRRAGIYAAKVATTTNTSETITNVIGSVG